jgi:hypothetical protein
MPFYSICCSVCTVQYERIREDRYPCGMLQPCGQIDSHSSPIQSCPVFPQFKSSQYGIWRGERNSQKSLSVTEEANHSCRLSFITTVTLWTSMFLFMIGLTTALLRSVMPDKAVDTWSRRSERENVICKFTRAVCSVRAYCPCSATRGLWLPLKGTGEPFLYVCFGLEVPVEACRG